MSHTLTTSPYSNYTFTDTTHQPPNSYTSPQRPIPKQYSSLHTLQYQYQARALKIINDRAVQALHERELKKSKTHKKRRNPLLRYITPHPPTHPKKHKKYEIRGMGEAPTICNIHSTLTPNGAIYHPCHGFSNRNISIFDLFPKIVNYSSKKFDERARAQFLMNLSDEHNTILAYNLLKDKNSLALLNSTLVLKKMNVDITQMWMNAFRYLFNDLARFEYMSNELKSVLRDFMSTNDKRKALLMSVKVNGFIAVLNNISVKLAENDGGCESENDDDWNILDSMIASKKIIDDQELENILSEVFEDDGKYAVCGRFGNMSICGSSNVSNGSPESYKIGKSYV